MTDFKGFDDWVEIFAGGKQIDSTGNEHDGDALIDNAVNTFNPALHSPPAVIGHPAQNKPSYAWVESLKTEIKDGVKVLFAKFKDVIPEFEEMVKKGMFKKRSSSFYPDGRLRHVGWLGAMPPAVKGLADVKFITAEDKAINFEIIETTKTTMEEEVKKMKFSEFMEAFKFWKKVQEDQDTEINDPTPYTILKAAAPAFTEAELEAAKTEAAKTAKEEAEKAVRAEFAEAESTRKKADVKAKIDGIIADGVKNGKIAPAWKDAGIGQFMESLDAVAAIEFGEKKDKKTGLDWFTSFLEGLPKLIDFAEIATRDKDVKAGNAGGKLDAMVNAKMKEKKDLSYSAAFMEVQKENPALVQEYQQEMLA
jgi:hypothetical protein